MSPHTNLFILALCSIMTLSATCSKRTMVGALRVYDKNVPGGAVYSSRKLNSSCERNLIHPHDDKDHQPRTMREQRFHSTGTALIKC